MLNYQIALTNVAFDNSYKNVLRFDTRTEQEAYFNVNTLFLNSPNVNFNVGSLTATNVIYDGEENESIGELLNKNYCIIKDNSPNATYSYYYYFVTNAMQDSDNRLKLSLELDIFQTYYIDLQFGECHIDKAHLNRFIDNGDGTVSFDGTVNSKLFEREDIKNVAKRLTKRSSVNIYGDSELGKWFNNNILGWIYIFLPPTSNYNFLSVQASVSNPTDTGIPVLNNKAKTGGNIPSNIGVAVYPLYKSNQRIKFTNENITATTLGGGTVNADAFWGSGGIVQVSTENDVLQWFANLNNGYNDIYTVKFSNMPPFESLTNITGFTIDNTGVSIPCGVSNGRIVNPFIDSTGGTSSGILTYAVHKDLNSNDFSTMAFIGYQEAVFEAGIYSVEKQLIFNKSDIINANKNIIYNPKLLGSDYFNLRISDQTENGFDYDLQKLNETNLQILYNEAIVPDMAKKYIRFGNLNGVYINETADNLTGFVSSNDTSIVMPTSAYQSMLANNKNFFLQNSLNRQFEATRGAMSTAGGAIGSFTSGNIGGGIQSLLFGGASIGLNYAQSKITENLTVDNLQNAPSNVVGAKGNAIFESMYSENGIIIEEWDILPNEKEMINDYMCQYGFTYNRVDNIKNVDNIRKIYNFVRADVETINGANISERVHEKFRQVFAQGVRFWNTDTFSYDKENYERWLENG